MRLACLFALTLLCLSPAVHAQKAESLLGRDVRVWSIRQPGPVTGVVTHFTPTFIRLTTGSRICDETGCSPSFSAQWTEVERVQVNSHGRKERLLRAVVIGGGAAAVLGVGLSRCASQAPRQADRFRSSFDSCHAKVVGITVSTAAVALFLSRPSWKDVELPEVIR